MSALGPTEATAWTPSVRRPTTVGRHARGHLRGAPAAGRIARVVSAALVCATLAGCGLDAGSGGPTRHFEPDGFGIAFDYPLALTEKTLRGNGPADKPDDIVRELTLTDDDFIAVRRDPLEADQLSSGISALQPVVDQLAKVLDDDIGPGRPVTVGGMPGFEYLDLGADVQQRYVFLLGRDALYLVHCRSTQQHRTEIAAACDTVQRTLHTA